MTVQQQQQQSFVSCCQLEPGCRAAMTSSGWSYTK